MPRSTAANPTDCARYEASHSVCYQLVQLVTLLRREVDLRMAAHGLTDAQWKPLWLLMSNRAGTAFEMAREMDVDAGAVTRLVDRLEGKGLIERERSETDRRVVHLRLTAAGQAAAAGIPAVLAGLNDDFLRGFSSAERQQVRSLIGRMLANGTALAAQKEEA